MPGTAFPTRPSLIYQGLLLGLFINGVARWGFASIIETPAALGELAPGRSGSHGWWGTSYPNITSDSVEIRLPDSFPDDSHHGNGNITFYLWEPERMSKLSVDGISVLLNDVERWRGYLDEDKSGEFTWHRHGHDGLELRQFSLADAPKGVSADFETQSDFLRHADFDGDGDDDPKDLFFRFAFLRGAEAGFYGPAGVWRSDGSWVSPDPPKE